MADWDLFVEVWDEFLKYMDRVVQWLKFVFTGNEGYDGEEWPPVDYPEL